MELESELELNLDLNQEHVALVIHFAEHMCIRERIYIPWDRKKESFQSLTTVRGTVKWMAINFITFAGPMCIGIVVTNLAVAVVLVVVVGNARQLINWKLRLMEGRSGGTDNRQ